MIPNQPLKLLKIITATTCSINGKIQSLDASSPGYILGSVTDPFRSLCTFRLKTREGYNLHLRLIDLATDKFNYTRSKNCIRYAHVRDGSFEKQVCKGSNRTLELWRSHSNVVDIQIAKSITSSYAQKSHFLIYYESKYIHKMYFPLVIFFHDTDILLLNFKLKVIFKRHLSVQFFLQLFHLIV